MKKFTAVFCPLLLIILVTGCKQETQDVIDVEFLRNTRWEQSVTDNSYKNALAFDETGEIVWDLNAGLPIYKKQNTGLWSKVDSFSPDKNRYTYEPQVIKIFVENGCLCIDEYHPVTNEKLQETMVFQQME